MDNINSNYMVSTKSYTGSVITDRFTATSTNQQFVKLVKKSGTLAKCNSVMIEADLVDLYVTPYYSLFSSLTFDVNENPVDSNTGLAFDFTGHPVFYIPAGEILTISGSSIIGLKFSNATGARYYVTALGY